MLFGLKSGKWEKELLERFSIPYKLMPEICGSSEVIGHTGCLGGKIPIAGIAGDQQAALFGQGCFHPGQVKNTYGTGCFLLMQLGDKPKFSGHGLLTTVAWRIGDRTQYALEGGVFVGGAVAQWLRDGLRIIKKASEIETLASTQPDNGGVYFVPAFAGLGAPHWDQYARGMMIGLTRGSTSGHLARAAIESIAFQSCDLLKTMEKGSGRKIKELRVDGGACSNGLLMQFQSDLLGIPVIRPKILEVTALGAASLAGLAVGCWSSPQEISEHIVTEQRFEPQMNSKEKKKLFQQWSRAVERSKGWASKQG